MLRRTAPLPPSSLCALWLLAAACAPGGAEAASPPSTPATVPAVPSRADDPELAELRRHLDLGHLERARPLLERRAGGLGYEGELLLARAAQLAGDELEAGRRIEAARRVAPRAPEVYATAAELHAAGGRLDTARRELEHGLEQAGGPTPELLRAQGIVLLCRPGHGERGLELLERARRLDRQLPFCDRALGQAYLLRAKEALRNSDRDGALMAVLRSLEHDPEDVDARRLQVDVLAALLRLEEALAVLEDLAARDPLLDGELALMEKRAAMGALLRRDRPRALELFRRARDRGLDAEELGSGARLLAEAGVAEYERALELLGEERSAEAEEALARALRFAPDYLAARYHLGVLVYRRAEFDAAAEHFARVVRLAEAEDLELPDPAHVALFHALRQAGRGEEARAALEAYLARRPGGEYAAATRALLETLDLR